MFAGRGAPPAHRPPSCTEDDSPQWEKTIGVVFGWVSTVIYLFSRIPQILKNIKRGSVEGLSPIMFFCAVMGNLTYAGGILIRARNEAAVIKALPYLVGSIGTLCFDFTILLQKVLPSHCQVLIVLNLSTRWIYLHMGIFLSIHECMT